MQKRIRITIHFLNIYWEFDYYDARGDRPGFYCRADGNSQFITNEHAIEIIAKGKLIFPFIP